MASESRTATSLQRGRGLAANDRGGASVITIALIAAVLMIGGAVILGAAASAAQIAVQHAADEAALAGAREARDRAVLGEPVAEAACVAAAGAAREQSATVARCANSGAVVTVDVELSRGHIRVSARAVAGPAFAMPY